METLTTLITSIFTITMVGNYKSPIRQCWSRIAGIYCVVCCFFSSVGD